MKKRLICAGVFLASALLFCGTTASAQTQRANESKQPLRVLYVYGAKAPSGGDSDTARAADFRQFLEANFAFVKTCLETEFKPALAKDVDVIIVDGNIADLVPADFHRPMVLLGADFGPLQLPETHGYKLRNA